MLVQIEVDRQSGLLASLPMVLRPKPAIVRLVDVIHGLTEVGDSGW